MKGIPGRVTKALPSQAKLDCADNTGAKVVQLITVLNKGGVARRYPAAGVGDMTKVTVKRGTPETRRGCTMLLSLDNPDHSEGWMAHGSNLRIMRVSLPMTVERFRVQTLRDR